MILSACENWQFSLSKKKVEKEERRLPGTGGRRKRLGGNVLTFGGRTTKIKPGNFLARRSLRGQQPTKECSTSDGLQAAAVCSCQSDFSVFTIYWALLIQGYIVVYDP